MTYEGLGTHLPHRRDPFAVGAAFGIVAASMDRGFLYH